MSRDAAARRNEQALVELLRDDANKTCADCGQKGTRWASWNLGVFLCIRCGGLHRKLGTHISKVKSVNLDKWTDEQIESITERGNAKVNAVYNPHPERFPFPAYSGDMEQYIRDKYERKLFMSSEARGAMPVTAASRASMSTSSSGSQVAVGRYPLQLKSLREMGFTDVNANAEAINAAKGNLQEAVEALLAAKTGRLSVGERNEPVGARRESAGMRRETSPTEDLVSIFGAPTAAPSASNAGGAPSRSENTSILDLDLPPPPVERRGSNANGVTSDEFEDFEAAPAARVKQRSPGHVELTDTAAAAAPGFENGDRRASINATGEQQPHGDKHKPKATATALPPTMGNPWASNNMSNGDAFDDIDPFRGFTPNHR